MSYGFMVAEDTARTYWAATDGSSTYYIGQLVTYVAASSALTPGTCLPLAVPAGVLDVTNRQVIAGIVVGFSDKFPTYNSTYGQYATGVTTQANLTTRKNTGIYNQGRGMYAPSDPQVLIEIAEVLPSTLIKGYICETGGTAPTVVTDTGGADSTGYTAAGTTSACAFTPVKDTCTIYCRTGANMGLYRTTNDTSATGPDTTVAFPNDVTLGDTFVRLSIKQGLSYMYISGPGLYIDNTLSGGTTNYFSTIVYHIDAREAGKEYAVFRFDPIHFSDTFRAAS